MAFILNPRIVCSGFCFCFCSDETFTVNTFLYFKPTPIFLDALHRTSYFKALLIIFILLLPINPNLYQLNVWLVFSWGAIGRKLHKTICYVTNLNPTFEHNAIKSKSNYTKIENHKIISGGEKIPSRKQSINKSRLYKTRYLLGFITSLSSLYYQSWLTC